MDHSSYIPIASECIQVSRQQVNRLQIKIAALNNAKVKTLRYYRELVESARYTSIDHCSESDRPEKRTTQKWGIVSKPHKPPTCRLWRRSWRNASTEESFDKVIIRLIPLIDAQLQKTRLQIEWVLRAMGCVLERLEGLK